MLFYAENEGTISALTLTDFAERTLAPDDKKALPSLLDQLHNLLNVHVDEDGVYRAGLFALVDSHFRVSTKNIRSLSILFNKIN